MPSSLLVVDDEHGARSAGRILQSHYDDLAVVMVTGEDGPALADRAFGLGQDRCRRRRP